MIRSSLIAVTCGSLWALPVFAQSMDGALQPMHDWSGAYVGAGLSYSSHSPQDETGMVALPSASGPSLSFLVGYTWQMDGLVLGVEAAANVGESVGTNGCCSTDIENFFLVRGHAGVATGDLRIFGTLGIVSDRWGLTVGGQTSSVRYNGIAIGTGAELSVSDRVSVRGDVEHYSFGSQPNATGDDVDYSTNLFRLSIIRSF